jgi:fermentation-respiration switch protein FrsA (DUF1100 family)
MLSARFMKTLTVIIGVYIAYCLFLFVVQRQILFPRNMIDTASFPASPTRGFETIWLELPFGRVESRYLPPPDPAGGGSAPLVIFAHGNAELIDFWPVELLTFHGLGMGLLLVEYPGYGRSQGTPSERTVVQTFVEAYDRLAERPEVDAARIVLFGRSLGGGAVCALAGVRPSAALILMSCFTRTRAFAPRYLAPPFLIRDPFDNLSAVSTYERPVLVLHGKTDEVIPFRHGLQLASTAPYGTLIAYDCGHNDFPPGWFTFPGDVKHFLEKAGILPAAKEPSTRSTDSSRKGRR